MNIDSAVKDLVLDVVIEQVKSEPEVVTDDDWDRAIADPERIDRALWEILSSIGRQYGAK